MKEPLRECRECGAGVLDERRHVRWHERVYVVAERKAAGPRFVGLGDDEQPDPREFQGPGSS